MGDNRLKIIFIAGAGRSGSTLLARMLGRFDDTISVGEIRWIWRKSLVDGQQCGCGEPFNRCAFWSRVIDRAFDREATNFEHVAALSDTVDRFYRIPQILFAGKRSGFGRLRDTYTRHLLKLYRAIREVSGARIIVDGSKDASMAFLLCRLPEIDLRVVHLVRDSRAVAYSWRRVKKRSPQDEDYMGRYDPVRSAISWSYRNLGSDLIRLTGKPYIRVRYEDFVADPVSSLMAMSAVFGETLDGTKIIQGHKIDLEGDHAVGGNPMRFRQGTIELKPDYEWKESMSSGDRRVVTALTLPLLWWYGYKP